MTKPDQKKQLRKDIKQLEQSRDERRTYLINNINAGNYDEIARDKRAIEVKIATKERQLLEFDSQRGESIIPCSVFIPLSFGYAKC